MTAKRICMISFHTCPLASEEGKETGGMNVYVLELSKALTKNGNYVDIYTRSQDRHHPMVVQVSEKLRVIHLPAGPQKGIAKKKLLQYIPEFIKNFTKFTEEEKFLYDVYHCHYYLSGLIGLDLKKQKNTILLIQSFHTLALMKNLVARTETEKESKERIDAEFLLIKEVEKIIAPSESDKEYLVYLYGASPEKIVVIPPGVNTELFRPIEKTKAKKAVGADEKDKIVLFVGRIEPLKGIDVLMYAIKILSIQCPNFSVCLWIVGGDISQKPRMWTRELQNLEKLRGVLNITTLVNFVGQRTQKELPNYYNASEVVVMPSHYESFGIAALEAMSCGVPVITTNVAGVSSLIDEKHAGLITSVNNPLLLASQIAYLLKDKKAREQVSKDVRKNVEDLTWKNVATKVERVYDELKN